MVDAAAVPLTVAVAVSAAAGAVSFASPCVLPLAMGLFLLGVLRPAVMEQEVRAMSRLRRGDCSGRSRSELSSPPVVGALLARGAGVLTRLRRHSLRLERAGGVTLVLVGVLLVTGLWDRVLVALQPAISGFTPVL